uniref:Uncharacterized protein n=1 Tax=Fibrocapsa japonica TaxID=94617 RepID=A0A6U1P8Q3_9STRA
MKTKAKDADSKGDGDANPETATPAANSSPYMRKVFFRCGNWCYAGQLSFGVDEVGLSDLPRVIPLLQRQQSKLSYYCTASSVPPQSEFHQALHHHWGAETFVADQLASDETMAELAKWGKIYTWINDDAASTYFELESALPRGASLQDVSLIASKTYSRGLVLIGIYHENSFYFVLQAGEGDQPLLDVRFPDVSRHGQGLTVGNYPQPEFNYRKLTLWHAVTLGMPALVPQIRDKQLTNLSSDNYLQTYVVMRPSALGLTSSAGSTSVPGNTSHAALFRFGSWCYSGHVQLTPVLSLKDIPHVIPALRMQQGRLEFLCDVTKMPSRSPFAAPMKRLLDLTPIIEEEVMASEDTLSHLLERMESMGLGPSVSSWLNSDSSSSFFEFQVSPYSDDDEVFKDVEVIASKCYHAQGVIMITVYYQRTIYVVVQEGTNEQPLLDSRFPDVSSRGRGYQVKSYDSGRDGWEQLRKVSIWQTQASLQAEIQQREQQAKEQFKSDADAKASNMIEGGGADVKDDKEAEAKAEAEAAAVKEEEEKREKAKADAKQAAAAPKLNRRNTPATKVALPHHLPPSEALQEKLEKMRAELGSSVGEAPWDARGRPRGLPLRK